MSSVYKFGLRKYSLYKEDGSWFHFPQRSDVVVQFVRLNGQPDITTTISWKGVELDQFEIQSTRSYVIRVIAEFPSIGYKQTDAFGKIVKQFQLGFSDSDTYQKCVSCIGNDLRLPVNEKGSNAVSTTNSVGRNAANTDCSSSQLPQVLQLQARNRRREINSQSQQRQHAANSQSQQYSYLIQAQSQQNQYQMQDSNQYTQIFQPQSQHQNSMQTQAFQYQPVYESYLSFPRESTEMSQQSRNQHQIHQSQESYMETPDHMLQAQGRRQFNAQTMTQKQDSFIEVLPDPVVRTGCGFDVAAHTQNEISQPFVFDYSLYSATAGEYRKPNDAGAEVDLFSLHDAALRELISARLKDQKFVKFVKRLDKITQN